MIVEIKGVQFVNKGAELMLYAIRQELVERYDDVKIVLRHNRNSMYESRSKFGSYQKLELDRFAFVARLLGRGLRRKLMNQWGVVTDADVDVVLDASGFAYGDQWGARKYKKLLRQMKIAKSFSQKYIFMPQAFGPFKRKDYLEEFRDALILSDLVCAREEQSYADLKTMMGERGNLKLFPDFTNLCLGVYEQAQDGAEKNVLIIPNSNMISTKNSNQRWRESYLHVLRSCISIIRKIGYVPVVLNHEGAADAEICDALAQSFDFDLDVIREDNPLRVKGLIGASAAIVCSRFHGCVSALSQGVPCIGTSWSHKYEQLFSEYEQNRFLLAPDVSEEELEQKLKDALEQTAAEQGRSEELITDKKAESREMWSQVFRVIES